MNALSQLAAVKSRVDAIELPAADPGQEVLDRLGSQIDYLHGTLTAAEPGLTPPQAAMFIEATITEAETSLVEYMAAPSTHHLTTAADALYRAIDRLPSIPSAAADPAIVRRASSLATYYECAGPMRLFESRRPMRFFARCERASVTCGQT